MSAVEAVIVEGGATSDADTRTISDAELEVARAEAGRDDAAA